MEWTPMSEAQPKADKTPDARTRLIGAAAKLFQERGYAATGLSEVLALAEAPKGSLYHHFPGGKAELGAAAMKAAGTGMAQALTECRGRTDTTADAVRAYGELLASWLENSNFVKGCPVATVALEEAPGDGPVAVAAKAAFDQAQQALVDMLLDDGIDEALACRRASLGLAALEGALIQARLARNTKPVRNAATDIADLLDQDRAD